MPDNYNKNWFNGSEYKYKVIIPPVAQRDVGYLSDVYHWLINNCSHQYSYCDYREDYPLGQNVFWRYRREYSFEDKEDALRFKMRWC